MYIDAFFSVLIFVINFTTPISKKVRFTYRFFLFAILVLDYCLFYSSSLLIYIALAISILFIILTCDHRIYNITVAVFSYFLSVIVNSILLFLLQKLLHVSVSDLYDNTCMLLAFYAIFTLLVFGICLLVGRFSKRYIPDWTHLPPATRGLALLVFLQLLLCAIILIFNITFAWRIGYPNASIIFNCVLFCLYFLISIPMLIVVVHTIRKNLLMEQEAQQTAALRDYTKSIEQSTQQLRNFKHDYLNTLTTLDEYIHSDKHQELAAFFDENLRPVQESLNGVHTSLMDLSKLHAPAVKSILYAKLNYAAMHTENVRLEILYDVKALFMNEFDLARVLGIYLDNAIEATLAAEEPQLTVAIIYAPPAGSKSTNDCLQIVVQNSFAPPAPDLTQIWENHYTTKGDGHGYGLYQASQLLDRCSNVQHYATAEGTIFRQVLILFPEETATDRKRSPRFGKENT